MGLDCKSRPTERCRTSAGSGQRNGLEHPLGRGYCFYGLKILIIVCVRLQICRNGWGHALYGHALFASTTVIKDLTANIHFFSKNCIKFGIFTLSNCTKCVKISISNCTKCALPTNTFVLLAPLNFPPTVLLLPHILRSRSEEVPPNREESIGCLKKQLKFDM